MEPSTPSAGESGGSGNGSEGARGFSAAEAAEKVRDRVESEVEGRKGDVAERVDRAADALRGAAGKLQGDEAWIAGIVERGADELASFADTLRTNDLRGLLSRAEEFARSQPVLFAGAAFALGFALTRAARVGLSDQAPSSYSSSSASTPRQEWRRGPLQGTAESGRMSLSGTYSGISEGSESTSGGSDSLPGGPGQMGATSTLGMEGGRAH